MSNFSTEIINIVNYFIGSTIKCLHGVWSYESVRLEKNCKVIAFEFFEAKNVYTGNTNRKLASFLPPFTYCKTLENIGSHINFKRRAQ